MSEKSLDNLIAKLKSEAVEKADEKAKGILEVAKADSQKIIEEAERERTELLQNAKSEAENMQKKGKIALQQAARDLSVSVRNDLLKLLKSVLEREVKQRFTPDFMEKAILKVLENVGDGAGIELPETIKDELIDKIQQDLITTDNLTSFTKDKNIINGFKISKKDEGWSYEITPEEVTEMLFAYLSPKWVQLIKKEAER